MAFAFLLLNTLSAITEESSPPETVIPGIFSDLLVGTSADTQSAVSSVAETDLPLALTLCETLKHKALHKDIALSPEAVEQVRASLEKRFEVSPIVSYKQTSTHTQKIPAREIIIEGQRLTVPEHFLAPIPFAITDFSPQGEAGTPFPMIAVSFAGGKPPMTSRMTLNGEPVKARIEKNTCGFQPDFRPENLLPVGTHTVSVALSAINGQIATASWSFTVGIKPVASPNVPPGAKLVGSFTVPLSNLVKDSAFKGDVLVSCFETVEGKRILEYTVFDPQTHKAVLKTTSVFSIGKFALRKNVRDELVRLSPQSPYAFVGNQITFSANYVSEGTIAGFVWRIYDDLGNTGSFETPTISWPLKDNTLIEVTIRVDFSLPDGGVYSEYHFGSKALTILPVESDFSASRDFILSEKLAERLPFKGKRLIRDPVQGQKMEIVEGKTLNFPAGSPGQISSPLVRFKIAGGTAKAKIEDPTASETKVIFESHGYVEIVHDVLLSFAWGEERYEGAIIPKRSALYGLFPYRASVKFKKFPPGIIFQTDRKIQFQEVAVEINGEKRLVSSQTGLYSPLDPPIILAHSELFPDSTPLRATILLVEVIQKLGSSFFLFPLVEDFQTTFSYKDAAQAAEGVIPCRAYFRALSWDLNLKRIDEDWDDLFLRWKPLHDWVEVKAFPNPAELVQVEIDPEAPEVFEGEDFKLSGKIVPKPGFGTGHLFKNGGALDLLDGYESQGIEGPFWAAKLLPQGNVWKTGSGLTFTFKPKEGTGTYEIIASTVIEVRERDTNTLAKAFGVSSTTAVVKTGLRILSPIDKFCYPLGYPIIVGTSLDDKPEEWKKIQWTLNNQPWVPDPAEPKPQLNVNVPGDYQLTAVYTASDGTLLSQTVSFFVKPVQVTISPQRKVMGYSQGLAVPLQVKIEFNGKPPIENSETLLDLGNGVTAKVTKVDWQTVSNPADGITFTVENNLLSPILTFNRDCAVTALATVTIALSKPATNRSGVHLKTHLLEETYTLPALRADAWAIQQPKWSPLNTNFPDDQLPVKAIAPAGRTFTIKNGVVSLKGETHAWSPQAGMIGSYSFQQAIPGPSPATSNQVKLVWSCPEGQHSETFSFVPTFKKQGTTEVKLQSYLVFDDGTEVAFKEMVFSVAVDDINNLVEYYINPKSFQMTIGETKTFDFVLKLKEGYPPPPPGPAGNTKGTELTLLNGVYKVSLTSVEWHYEIGSSPSSLINSAEFLFAPGRPGNYKIFGKANALIEEKSLEIPAKFSWPWEPIGESSCRVDSPKCTIFVNEIPVASSVYHLGQEINLSFKIEGNPPVKKQTWFVSPPVPTYSLVQNNQFTGKVVNLSPEDFSQKKISFYLYDWDEAVPEKQVTLTYVIGDASFEESVKIPYARPRIVNSTPSQNDAVDLFPNSTGGWFLGFQKVDGITITGAIENHSDTSYKIGFTQLIRMDNRRDLATNGLIIKEVQKTVLPKDPTYFDSKFWLDTDFDVEYNHITVSPNDTTPNQTIFSDSPYSSLVATHGQPMNSDFSFAFVVFILAKPANLMSIEGVWCPIKVYKWDWHGAAIFHLDSLTWEKVQAALIVNKPEEVRAFFPEWSYKAESGKDPYWRKVDEKKNTR